MDLLLTVLYWAVIAIGVLSVLAFIDHLIEINYKKRRLNYIAKLSASGIPYGIVGNIVDAHFPLKKSKR